MASNPPWCKLWVNDWLSSTEIMLLAPLEELALFRLRLHMWKSPTCMLPDDDAILGQLSRLKDHYRDEGGGTLTNHEISKCLASVKQVLRKCDADGTQMIFDPELLAEWKEFQRVSSLRSKAGVLGNQAKSSIKTRGKRRVASATQTVSDSVSDSVSGSDSSSGFEKEELSGSYPPENPRRTTHSAAKFAEKPQMCVIGKYFRCTEDEKATFIAEDGDIVFADRVAKINDHCANKGPYKDYAAAYRTFRRNAAKFDGIPNGNGHSRKKSWGEYIKQLEQEEEQEAK